MATPDTPGPDATHQRPEGVSDITVEAPGKLSEALEVAEHARGYLYGFHRLTGKADLNLSEAEELFRKAGHPGIADRLATEIIGTFVLVFVVIGFSAQNGVEADVPAGLASLGALPVALLVVGIGASLGGPTGYAINPARDLGPRIAHALLPIKGKGSSDWAYAWVPVLGPLVGGAIGGLVAAAYIV